MINRILMELYDEYLLNNIEPLIEFSKKTLPSDGTDKLFVGCVLIMFSRANGFNARYDCTRENLLSIVYAIKERIGNSNLLQYYIDRINTVKGIKKYFDDIDMDKHVDLLIEYLEQFKPGFIESIMKYNDKIDDYIKNSN